MAHLALLAERDEFKNRCEELALESRCVSSLVIETKKLQEEVAKHEKRDALAKGALAKGRGKKQASVSNNRVVILKVELTETKALHKLTVVVAAQFSSGTNNT